MPPIASQTSQRRWRASPKGRDYFRGPANRLRVQAWRKTHPGYWRRRRQKSGALQDHCLPQVLVPAGDKSILAPRALQDVIRTQGLALTGLVAQLTGSALQENIASTTRRLILLGRQVQEPSSRRPGHDRNQETRLVPRATAARAAAHLTGADDTLVKLRPLLELVGDWRQLLSEPPAKKVVQKVRRHERTGRPRGSDRFVARLERKLGLVLRPRKPGPKPRRTNPALATEN